MKRRKLSRRALAGLPPGPVYRDIRPDREAVCVYGDDGEPALVFDCETRIMDAVRVQAKRDRVPLARLLIAVMTVALDRFERGA